MEKIKRFLNDDTGLELSEYAVAAALIIAAAALAFTNLGTAIATRIGQVVTTITGGGGGV